MRALTYGDVSVLGCDDCGGVFAGREVMTRSLGGDVAAFRALADEATRAPPRPKTTPFTLACPICRAAMTSLPLEAARCIVDVCRAHGVWLDRWEAQMVADAATDPSTQRALRRALRA